MLASGDRFQSTPSLRKVTWWCDDSRTGKNYFNPHLPCGRWRVMPLTDRSLEDISIHTFLAEGDIATGCGRRPDSVFQSTPSLRKVTHMEFQNLWDISISIHTFLAEGDARSRRSGYLIRHISIHTFLAEGDIVRISNNNWSSISIHTFLAEGDFLHCLSIGVHNYFNPHLPCGRWLHLRGCWEWLINFNPHLPCGRWLVTGNCRLRFWRFQSTPSLRKVTLTIIRFSVRSLISIHTFLAEGDRLFGTHKRQDVLFQSTPSLRKVTFNDVPKSPFTAFQSTPSLRKVT